MGQRCRPCQPFARFSFEPAGLYAPYDAYFSDRLERSIGMRLAQWLFALPPATGPTQADEIREHLLLTHILKASLIDRVVALAFDQYHTTDGRPLGPAGRRREAGSDLYVSNTYARDLWRRHPDRILFGASIHPYRTAAGMTAIDMLAEVAAAGAVLVKWLPFTQNIDAEDPRTVAFLGRAAELGVPMLIHYGGERALGRTHPEFQDPSGLLRTLRRLRGEGRMPIVIVAHAATPTLWPISSSRYHRILADALTHEFADAPLYADTAALALFSRAHWLKRFTRIPGLQRKLVHGSDFPIPPTPLAFRFRLGGKYHEICRMPSWIDRDAAIKSTVGLGDDVIRRSGVLLRERIAVADTIAHRV